MPGRCGSSWWTTAAATAPVRWRAASPIRGSPCVDGRAPAAGWSGKLWAVAQGLPSAGDAANSSCSPTPTSCMIRATSRRWSRRRSAAISTWCRKWWRWPATRRPSSALVPAFVFFFQLLYPFAWVNDPLRATAAAAGGTILIRRRALRADRRHRGGARRADRRRRAGGGGEARRAHLARPLRAGALGACLSRRGRHLAHGVAHRLCAVALLAAAAGRHRAGDDADVPAAAVRRAVRPRGGALVRLAGLGRDGSRLPAHLAPLPPLRACGRPACRRWPRSISPRRSVRRSTIISVAASRGRVAPIRVPAHERCRHRRGVVRQGSRRRELSGRLAADPPRPARACARVLCVRAQRRRHRGFRRPCRRPRRSRGST